MKTISLWLVAVLISVCASARPCPPIPPTYRDRLFGTIRFAIEQRCSQSLTATEQLYVAGMAQRLKSKCDLPISSDDRAIVDRFLRSSQFVAAIGSDYSNPRLDRTLGNQTASGKAFIAGIATIEEVRCDEPAAALLSRGIVLYLKRTSGGGSPSRFVSGCVAWYANGYQYTEEQCRCVADTIRAVLPNVHDLEYSPTIVSESTKRNPFAGIVQWLGCGIGNY